MNKIILIGNLGQDAEEKAFQPSGDKYWVLNVATTERWKDKDGNKQEKTTWHRCQLTGKYDNLIPYLRKGQQVAIMGEQRHESYDFKDRNTNAPVMYDGKAIKMSMSFVRINNVELVGGKRDDNQGQSAAVAPQAGAAAPATAQAAPAPQPQAGPVSEPQAGNFDPQHDDLPF